LKCSALCMHTRSDGSNCRSRLGVTCYSFDEQRQEFRAGGKILWVYGIKVCQVGSRGQAPIGVLGVKEATPPELVGDILAVLVCTIL